MTKIYFGTATEEVTADGIVGLDGRRWLYKDLLPTRWEKIPARFQEQFGRKAIYIAIRAMNSTKSSIDFLAEWDDMDSYLFRGEEIWIARSNRAHVAFRARSPQWTVSVEAGGGLSDAWAVVPRIGKVAFQKSRCVSRTSIPSPLLKEIVRRDSRADRFIWWKNVEDGVDGALRGSLPRDRGFRARFDAIAQPTFARFESISLSKQISISCRDGSIGGRFLLPSEAFDYFHRHILPNLSDTT